MQPPEFPYLVAHPEMAQEQIDDARERLEAPDAPIVWDVYCPVGAIYYVREQPKVYR